MTLRQTDLCSVDDQLSDEVLDVVVCPRTLQFIVQILHPGRQLRNHTLKYNNSYSNKHTLTYYSSCPKNHTLKYYKRCHKVLNFILTDSTRGMIFALCMCLRSAIMVAMHSCWLSSSISSST